MIPKRFICILSLLIIGLLPLSAQVTVKASIDSLSILLGDQTHMRLEVTCNASQQVTLPLLQDSLPCTLLDAGPFDQIRDSLSCDIEIVGDVKTDTIHLNDGRRVQYTQDFVITSFNPGLYQIDGLKVMIDSIEYTSEDMALKVVIYDEVLPKDNKIDDEYTYTIFNIKNIRRMPLLFSEVVPVLVALAILIVLVLLFLYILHHYRTNSPILQRITLEPILPAHIKAQNLLAVIREEKGWAKEDSKEYYTELTDALRQYIQNRFGVNATEMTTSQVLDHLTGIADDEQVEEIRELLITSDFAKFAKYHPMQNEKMQHFDVVSEYVDATKVEQDESEEPKIEYVVVKKGLSPTSKGIMLGTLILFGIVAIAVYVWMILYSVNLFF
jgi:hypothetical protein